MEVNATARGLLTWCSCPLCALGSLILPPILSETLAVELLAYCDILWPLPGNVCNLFSFFSFLLDFSFLFAIDIISNTTINVLSEIQITQVLILIYYYSSEMNIPNKNFYHEF